MKTIAGAVLVLAGAVLYSGAAIESALQKRPNPIEVLGLVVGFFGIILVVAGLFERRDRPRE